MLKYLFILNPAAGKGKALKFLPQLKSIIRESNIECKIKISKNAGHATEIVRNLAKKYDIIVSVGGDGTLNEVINGIDLNNDKILGVLPVGSGNDFSINLKLPKSYDEIVRLYFKHELELKNLDIGLVEYKEDKSNLIKQHKFINNLGIGFDAFVAFLNQKNKFLSGLSSYIVAVFRALTHYKVMKIHGKIDEINIKKNALLVTFGNGITSGGGFYLTPNAIIDDGLLDVCIIDFVNRIKLLRKLPLALINKIEKVPEVSLYRCNRADINLDNPYFIHTDGEAISSNVISLNVSMINNSLRVISGT